MKHSVPQFIDIEDKIIGPFTINQFIYLVGGAGLAYMSFRFLPSPISLILALFSISIAIFLAFIKVNGRNAEYMIYSCILYTCKPKLYIWGKKNKSQLPNQKELDNFETSSVFSSKKINWQIKK